MPCSIRWCASSSCRGRPTGRSSPRLPADAARTCGQHSPSIRQTPQSPPRYSHHFPVRDWKWKQHVIPLQDRRMGTRKRVRNALTCSCFFVASPSSIPGSRHPSPARTPPNPCGMRPHGYARTPRAITVSSWTPLRPEKATDHVERESRGDGSRAPQCFRTAAARRPRT
jgi:hypothetical protein